MTLRSADAVVVGGGVIGAALAHALARAGLTRTVLCDQGRVAAQGATSRSGGLLRMHHTAHCDTRLAARALRVFERWDEEVGGDCGYRRTGFLMLVGRAHTEALRTNAAAVAAAGGPHRSRVVGPADIGDLYPGLATDGVAAAAYEPDGGYADPVATTRTLLAAARRLGVEDTEGVAVREVREHEGRVTGVRTTLGRIDTPLVVLAGGAWGAAPAARLGVHVPVTARRIGLARTELPGAGLRGTGSSLPTCVDDTTGCYFRPEGADRLYFGVPSDPDVEPGRDVAPLTGEEVATAVAAVSRRVPGVGKSPVTGARAGFDGYTPDRKPVIGPAGPDGLYLALGFSGGGFKLAPAVAELAAAEITEGQAVAGKAPHELLEPYRPQRFGDAATPACPIVPEAPYDHS